MKTACRFCDATMLAPGFVTTCQRCFVELYGEVAGRGRVDVLLGLGGISRAPVGAEYGGGGGDGSVSQD